MTTGPEDAPAAASAAVPGRDAAADMPPAPPADAPADSGYGAAAHAAAAPAFAPLGAFAGEGGWLRELGPDHAALFRDGNGTLLVEFDELPRMARRGTARPWSHGLGGRKGWATLTLASQGRTFFRDAAVTAFFDELVDEAWFDDYDQVIFVGGGAAGYAAAAYSVAAPGAVVFLAAPLATLDRDVVPWEHRFRFDRARAFGPRYGYAPDMIGAAERVYIVTDPLHRADAAHAALFRAPHVARLPAPGAGAEPREALDAMGILARLVAGAASGALTPLRFAELWRARREDEGWLRGFMRRVESSDRPWLTALAAGWMHARDGEDGAARRRLNDALARLEAEGRTAPGDIAPVAPEPLRWAGE
jgi:hypothetical protein